MNYLAIVCKINVRVPTMYGHKNTVISHKLIDSSIISHEVYRYYLILEKSKQNINIMPLGLI